MAETPKDKDQEKGDEVLRRLLRTPPKPHDKTVGPITKKRRAETRRPPVSNEDEND
jgi:hypothetical protein